MIYEGALTEAFKVIIANELYDTGALYDSLQIYSDSTGQEIFFEITSEEYIVYHIERLDLINRMVEFPEFVEAYEKYIKNIIETEIEQSLLNNTAPDVEVESIFPRCFIRINGE